MGVAAAVPSGGSRVSDLLKKDRHPSVAAAVSRTLSEVEEVVEGRLCTNNLHYYASRVIPNEAEPID